MIRKTLLILLGCTIGLASLLAQNIQKEYKWNGSTKSSDATSQSSTTQGAYQPQDDVIRVALLLPFIQGSKNVSVDRITEYYEGFLLAVQKMKERGLNAEIYTFDIDSDDDTDRLKSILCTNELKSLQLIIGGVSEQQVQLLSDFSAKTGIKYVVPFSNKDTGVESNKNMFQVANSPTNLFQKIIKGFTTTFADANIIIMDEMASDRSKLSFVESLQNGLIKAGLSFSTAPSSPSITDDLNTVLSQSKRNIIIPTSSSETTLKRLMDAMPVLSQKYSISLFGYPEWQAYVNQTLNLHRFDSYIYSMFYLDSNNPEVQQFADKYKKWYNKNFIASLPKYAHMGYDTGLVFLTGLKDYGSSFETYLNDSNVSTLQSALYFVPIDLNGGYINTGAYFINLKPDGTVVKTDISKL